MNMHRPSRTARPYNNALREEHARHTREKILETGIELLRDGTLDGLQVAKIAERSGISPATIYRHFPDRDALFEGVDRWIGEKLGRPPFPASVDELIDGAPALFRYYDNAYELLRLARDNPGLRELNAPRRKERDEQIAAMTAELAHGLDPRRARAVGALVRTLYGFEAYETMRERFGVDGETATQALVWAVRALLDALAKERGRAPAPNGTPRRASTRRGRDR